MTEVPDSSLYQYDAKKHQYTVDGEVVPSVTQICEIGSAYIYRNYKDTWMRDEAARKGTYIHELCEDLDCDAEVEVEEEYQGYIEAYLKFHDEHPVYWMGMEAGGCNKELGYAGRFDRWGYWKDEHGRITEDKILVDIKTNSSITAPVKEIYKAQLAGYKGLIEALLGDAHAYILHLKKDGTYKLIDAEGGKPLFMMMLEIYKLLNPKKRKREKK